MKKGVAALLVVFLCLAFSGCAEVFYSVTIDSYGGRVVDYTVSFENEEDFENDLAVVKSIFEYAALDDNYAASSSTDNSASLTFTYETLTDYYVAMGITGDEPNQEAEYNAVNLFFREYVANLSPATAADFARYALTFLSKRDLSFEESFSVELYSATQNEISQYNILPKALKKTIDKLAQNFVLSDYSDLLKGDFASQTAQFTAFLLSQMGYDYTQVNAYFCYSHGYKSVYPKQFESSYQKDGQTVYRWKLDGLADNTFTVYQKIPVVWVWELFAIALALIVFCVLITLVVIKRKKGKKQNSDIEIE